jgi:HrpA-like RNA helicase
MLSEEVKIEFTRILHQLRDGSVKEYTFPPDLSTNERKFLHKLSEDLGLKSKSHGKGDKRCINIKKYSAVKTESIPQTVWSFSDVSGNTLRSIPAFGNSNAYDFPMAQSKKGKSGGFRDPTASYVRQCCDENNYKDLQSKRTVGPNFHVIETHRSRLPAYEFRETIPKLSIENQIILISGETGRIIYT